VGRQTASKQHSICIQAESSFAGANGPGLIGPAITISLC